MKSQHPNGIRIESDTDIHRSAGVCSACTPGWPLPHGCGGNVHAEKRHDIEAWYRRDYHIERCDACSYEREIDQ